MKPLIDISDKQTITVTAYPDPATYSYTCPNDAYALIRQISIGCNQDFQNNGRVQIKLNGTAVTTKSNALQEVQLISGLTIDFKEGDFVIIPPQSKIEVNARVTTGTGLIQPMVSGVLLSPDEYELLKIKYLGGK